MSKTYETGHAKNVANFESLIINLTGYAGIYSPTNTNIILSSLNQKAEAAKFITRQVNELAAASASAIAARVKTFEPLSKLSTKIFNSLKASNLSPSVVDSAITNHRKLQGRRASVKLTAAQQQQLAAGGTVVNQISASQQSFDNKLDLFDKQIRILLTIPQYAPNETELKLTTLLALQNELMLKNRDVMQKKAELINVRLKRDEILYHPDHGMVALALDAKSYCKSLFGISTAEYKQISGISFKLPKT